MQMKISPLFLIPCLFAFSQSAKARELEDSLGLPVPLYTNPNPETFIDARMRGEIDGFPREPSRGEGACGSCGS